MSNKNAFITVLRIKALLMSIVYNQYYFPIQNDHKIQLETPPGRVQKNEVIKLVQQGHPQYNESGGDAV